MSHGNQIRIRIGDHESEVLFAAEDFNRIATAHHLTKRLTQLLDDRFGDNHDVDWSLGKSSMSAVHMDLSQLSFLSSVGINELINMNRKSKSRGVRFVLENVQDSLRGILQLTRVERMFEIDEQESYSGEVS